jgi:type I restriction enzyme S subunit
MEVTPGYKQTQVGMIPEEWDVRPLGRLFVFTNGVNAAKESYGQGFRFVNVLEPITYSHLYGPEIHGRVAVPDAVANAYAVKRGDVLFNRTSETDAELGLATTYLGTEHVVFGGFVIRGRPTDDSLDPKYSGYALRAPFIRAQVVPLGQGAVRANIGQRNLGLVAVPVPPLLEQRAIATALSDVDSLLGALDGLIAKKRDLKQAATQQLLTGQTRLPGFTCNWESRRVAEMGDVLAGKALNVHGLGALRPYLRTKNVLDGRIDLEDVLQMPMTDTEFNRFRIEHGDVLLNEGQSIELVGRCSMYRDELGSRCAMQNQLLRFRAHAGTSPAFAEHLFRRCQHSGVFATIATQTTSVAHLGSSRFSDLRLSWPIDPNEQGAIAAALSDMDAELSVLEARRDKTRAIKQGMMQELLTGRTRLVPTGVANA